jgi:hypothetical protein
MITSLLFFGMLFGFAVSKYSFETDIAVLSLSKIDSEPQDHHQHALGAAMKLASKVRQTILEESRILQETNVTDPILQTPAEVCAMFNNQTVGLLTCECSRFGTRETQVNCTYVVPLCSSDNSTCFTGSISQVINEDYKARVVTTCTNFTQSVAKTPDAETCIRVFPTTDGNFSTIQSCSATFQPTGASKPTVCSSCSVCAADDTSKSSRSNSTANPRITVNCCNVQTDAIQTCGPVDVQSGSAVPLYDIILPENMGTCTSDGNVSRVRFSMITTATMMLLWVLGLAS